MSEGEPLDRPEALELLRPALEQVLLAARAREREVPPRRAPVAVRPFLDFTRLRHRALVALRRAADDEGLRVEALRGADLDELGPSGLLFLERPDGWYEAVVGAADHVRAARVEASAAAERDQLVRRVDELEELVAASRSRVEGLERDLADVEHARQQAVEAGEHARRELEQLRQRADTLGARARAAEERARAAETTIGQERARRRQLRDELDRRGGAAVDRRRSAPADDRSAADRGRDEPAEPQAVPALRAAAEAAGSLAETLRALGETLAERSGRDPTAAPGSTSGAGGASGGPLTPTTIDDAARAVRAVQSGPPARPARRQGNPRRRPRRAPGLDDTDPGALGWLLAQAGVVMIVDGYNVTIGRWAHLDLAHQRRRLVDALIGGCGAGAEVRVVFDGVDDGGRGGAAPLRSPVAVEFTPTETEADDRILDLVDSVAPDRPVVVASSDERVRRGARDRGANAVSSSQLLAHLGVSLDP